MILSVKFIIQQSCDVKISSKNPWALCPLSDTENFVKKCLLGGEFDYSIARGEEPSDRGAMIKSVDRNSEDSVPNMVTIQRVAPANELTTDTTNWVKNNQ